MKGDAGLCKEFSVVFYFVSLQFEIDEIQAQYCFEVLLTQQEEKFNHAVATWGPQFISQWNCGIGQHSLMFKKLLLKETKAEDIPAPVIGAILLKERKRSDDFIETQSTMQCQ